jgi:hypothetical protein
MSAEEQCLTLLQAGTYQHRMLHMDCGLLHSHEGNRANTGRIRGFEQGLCLPKGSVGIAYSIAAHHVLPCIVMPHSSYANSFLTQGKKGRSGARMLIKRYRVCRQQGFQHFHASQFIQCFPFHVFHLHSSLLQGVSQWILDIAFACRVGIRCGLLEPSSLVCSPSCTTMSTPPAASRARRMTRDD